MTRSRTAVAGGVALGLVGAAVAGMPAQAINGDIPTGPGNVEVFPQRDMVAIEGYAEQAGKTATFKVIRNGTVVGSAVGTVDATGFLETNHPGGICWGEGTSLKVTPDIQANDVIRVEFSDGNWDGSKVSDVEVTEVDRDDVARTLTLRGRYGSGVDMPNPADLVADPGKFGVEIVNPDMRDNTSAIGERAIGWPTDEAPTGHTVDGTVTGSDADGGTFSVTYGFRTVEDLDLADAGEVTALAWLGEPADVNVEAQYGLTLNEFYEHGGPGMGGCPPGPEGIRPTAPSVYAGRGAGPGSISVSWEAGSVTPDAAAIDGYRIRAVTGEDEVGKRLGVDARSTTLTGLVPGEIYSVEISATSDSGESKPVVMSRIAASDHVTPAATAVTAREPDAAGVYQPLVVENGVDYGVFLDPAAGVLGATVHYTLDGSTPTRSSRTLPVGTSLQIEQDTLVRWLVVDSGNVVGDVAEKFFDIVEADTVTQPAPGITGVAVADVSGALDVTFEWLSDPSVTTYQVQAYADGVKVGAPVDVPQVPGPETALTQRITGLTDGTPYTFTVAARYGTVWSVPSAPSEPVAPVTPASVDAGPDQTVLRDRAVTLDGTGSYGATGYAWSQVQPATGSQDPVIVLGGVDPAKPTFRFPKQTHPGDDGTFTFELTATYAGGLTKTDTVEVTQQKDAVVAQEARWRAGKPIRLNGTGSQNGAVLTFIDIRTDGSLGDVVTTATVANGAWAAPGVTVNLSSGRLHVWSDYGYVGTIQTTR